MIPDVSVFWPDRPATSPPGTLPLIAIEILSPDDRMSDVRDRLQEYADWGVAHIWLADPDRKIFYLFKKGLHEVKTLTVEEVSLTISPGDIFD